MRLGVTATLTAAAMAAAVIADDEAAGNEAIREANRDTVAQQTKQWQAAFKDQADIRVWPGVMANRKSKVVRFFAEATGISGSTPIEFFLIGERSGHDYEAIATALARPRAIFEAMRFLGIPTGIPADPQAFRFWTKGELASIRIGGVRAEQLILNTESGEPLRQTGLIFTGSKMVPDVKNPEQLTLAAEALEPFSIAANYNESRSLFDVPWQALQGSVYNKQIANTNHLFESGALLPVEIQPQLIDGGSSLRTFTLRIGAGDKGCILADEGSDNGLALPFAEALAKLTDMRDKGYRCYVSVHFADSLPLSQVCTLAGILQHIDTDEGIHIEPPSKGQLFYRAFVPPPAYADRDERIQQPWELRITRKVGALHGVLTHITETWNEQTERHEISTADYPVANGEELVAAFQRLPPGLPVIIVFVDRATTLTHGELMAFVGPATDTHPMVFVFLQ